MKNWYVIRADAGLKMGIGHIMRCMALAEWALDYGLTAVLITKNLSKELEKKIKLLDVNIKTLPDNVENNAIGYYAHSTWLSVSEQADAEQTASIIKYEQLERGCSPCFILVDHYALAAPWEKKINQFGPILCIDDLNDRPHHCNWLIDQTFNKTPESYKGLINESCELFIGATFALLRKEFQVPQKAKERNFPHPHENWHVLVTLGGVDRFNITGAILTLLSQTKVFHRMNITTVIGTSNPNLKKLKLLCAATPERIKLLLDVNNMSELMRENNLCIGAAGSTSWERCATSLPTLMVVLADNQLTIAENLDKGDVCINIGRADNLSLQNIEKNLLRIMSQPEIYRTMVNNSHKVCDGLGCKRILTALMGEISC